MRVVTSQDLDDQTIKEIQQATCEDELVAKSLRYYITNGWPDQRDKLPDNVKIYFSFRDTLSVDNDLITKGERIWIPIRLRAKMKHYLHAAHLGYDSMMRRARQSIFWPGMAKEIKQITDNCETCQIHKPCQPKEPLVQHDIPSQPWHKIGLDIFLLDGIIYLISVCYLSFFIEFDMLPRASTKKILTMPWRI